MLHTKLTGKHWPIRLLSKVILALTLVMTFNSLPLSAESRAVNQADFYVVKPDDTWQTISAAFQIPLSELWQSNGVVNPLRLEAGQRLFIAGRSTSQNSVKVLETEDNQPTLVWAAFRNSVSLPALMALNGLNWSSVILPHTPLAAPNPLVAVVEANFTSAPTDTARQEYPEGALNGSLLGIQGHFAVQEGERGKLLDDVAYDLGFGWVKSQVDWSRIEYAPSQYSHYLDDLDGFVEDSFNRNLHVLLSVVKAPDWARTSTDLDGPPTDYSAYYSFLTFLVNRYRFKIHAVEIWNEPNLRREWNNGQPLSGASYVRLLSGAYTAVKQSNGNLVVVSAGLAPTGVNNDDAKNDRVYLREMYDAGLANYTDAVGIHPYGWANPPDVRCCGDSGGIPTHNDDPSFFFLNTIEDYRAIQGEYGDANRKLWATEFGWGTMDGLNLPVTEEQPFFAYLDQVKQAEYILRAYEMAQQWDFMGPMFLWNLNVATLDGEIDANQAGYSILGLGRKQPREAYRVLRDAPKIDDLIPTNP